MQMIFMKASGTDSETRVPDVEAIAVSTSAAVQIPCASTPAASASSKASASDLPPCAGSSDGHSAWVRERPSAGAGKPG